MSASQFLEISSTELIFYYIYVCVCMYVCVCVRVCLRVYLSRHTRLHTWLTHIVRLINEHVGKNHYYNIRIRIETIRHRSHEQVKLLYASRIKCIRVCAVYACLI